MEIEGVKGVHDIHIWSICSNIHAMSAHVLVDRIHVQQTEVLINKISGTVRTGSRSFIQHYNSNASNVFCLKWGTKIIIRFD